MAIDLSLLDPPAAAAPAPAECRGCTQAYALVLSGVADLSPCRAEGCGAVFTRTTPVPRPRVESAPAPATAAPARRTSPPACAPRWCARPGAPRLAPSAPRQDPAALSPEALAFVSDLLSWDRQVYRAERSSGAVGGWAPGWAAIATLARLGIVGSGCRGTKGAASGSTPERQEARAPNPQAEARHRRLSPEARRTATAVTDDGQGEQLIDVQEGARSVAAPLAARVGLALADARQAQRWRACISRGDAAPFLRAAAVAGAAALERAAREWWGEPESDAPSENSSLSI